MESLSKTTALIVEMLVGGILLLIAIIFLVFNILSLDLLSFLKQHPLPEGGFAFLIVLFTAISYCLGVIAEPIGRVSFEWLLNRIKRKYLRIFISNNEVLAKDCSMLKPYLNGKKMGVNEAATIIGELRYAVLKTNHPLYIEIESKLAKFRLMRILVLVEFIMGVSFVSFPPKNHWLVWLIWLIFGAAIIFNIVDSYKRYCWNVLKAYKIILIENPNLSFGKSPK